MTKVTPTIWCLLATASLTAALAACGPVGTSGSPVGVQPSASSSASLGSPPGTSPVANSGGTSRCHTAQLKVTIADNPGGGAAGTSGVFLVFTNTSNATCTMYGFAGVSFVAGPSGQQVNDPATRISATPTNVNLASKGSGHSDLLLANASNFGAECKPVQVEGFRVYPPDETASVVVNSPQTVCSAKGVGVPRIGPVKPGASG